MYSYGLLHMVMQKQGGQLERTYSSSCENTECSPGDLPEAMNDREGWWESVRDISADGHYKMMMMMIVKKLWNLNLWVG